MANEFEMKIDGLEEFKKAIVRNQKVIMEEAKEFLRKGMLEYKRGIMRNPWRIGMSGGGSPVATIASAGYVGGTTRDTHLTEYDDWEAKIRPTTGYSEHIHKKRPWMTYVFRDKMPQINKLEQDLLSKIVNDLAK